MQITQPVKRIFTFMLGFLGAIILFGLLGEVVQMITHLSDPAANMIYGPTPQRLWATAVATLGLIALVIGWRALFRPASRFSPASRRRGAIIALVLGLIVAVNGGLVLTLATGGLGTGNGVAGGAAALVLGVITLPIGGLALSRSRRTG
jgi:hypothetical protein